MSRADTAPRGRKDVLWPTPDWAGVVASGVDHQAAAMMKLVRDRLPTRPDIRVRQLGTRFADEIYREPELVLNDFETMMMTLRGEMEACRTVDDVRNCRRRVIDRIKALALSEVDTQHVIRALHVKHVDVLNIDYRDHIVAEEMVRKGWPCPPPPAWREGHHVRNEGSSYALVRGAEFVEGGFPSEQAAWDWLRHERGDDRAPLPARRAIARLERAGPDLPEAPADERDLASRFGFAAVEFGRSMTLGERERMLNLVASALADLARCLNVPSNTLGLGGTMRLAIGCRLAAGRGGADYDPVTRTVLLPRHIRVGELANRWFRGLDHWSSGSKERLPKWASNGVSADDAVAEAWRTLMDTMRTGSFVAEARKLDGDGDFWSRPPHLASRAFEAFLSDVLQARGERNDALVSGAEDGAFTSGYRGNPFPAGEERTVINGALAALVAQTRERMVSAYADPATSSPPSRIPAWRR